MIESQPVVALVGRHVRLRERFHSGGQGVGRVLFGAGRARGVDGALGLVHLLARRLSAPARREAHEQHTDPDHAPQ